MATKSNSRSGAGGWKHLVNQHDIEALLDECDTLGEVVERTGLRPSAVTEVIGERGLGHRVVPTPHDRGDA